MRVLIAGGGLAGLSAAIALGRRGHAVTVVELIGRTDGAILSVTNRAVEALETLGVLEPLRPKAFVLDGTSSLLSRVYDGKGEPLPVPEPPPRTDTRLPASISPLRADLARILTAAAVAAGATIRIGQWVTAIDDGPAEATVTFADGTTETFDLIVGADGLHSGIRALAFPGAPAPRYTGHMSFRWLVPDAGPGPAGLYALPDNAMLITVRLPGDLMYLCTGVDMARRAVAAEEARQLLRGVLDRFEAPLIRALAARIDDAPEIIVRPYDWLLVPPPWHRGRVVLIGDALHATTAHLASGGSLAIEDAVVLAEELARPGPLGDRLTAFASRRFSRVKMVVEASVELLRLQQARAAPAQSAALRAAATAALREPY